MGIDDDCFGECGVVRGRRDDVIPHDWANKTPVNIRWDDVLSVGSIDLIFGLSM